MAYKDGTEYDKDGKEKKGGGFMAKGGKLFPKTAKDPDGDGDDDTHPSTDTDKDKGSGVPGEAEKSMQLTGDELEKSLHELEVAVARDDAPSRKAELLQKAMTSNLSKAESAELFALTGGGTAEVPTAGEALTKGFDGNAGVQRALDVSDFLREQHVELTKSLKSVGDQIEATDNRRQEINLLLCKAVCNIGNMVKSIAETIDATSAQPARAPKSRGVTAGVRVLEKGFNGQPPAAEELNKGMILDAMTGMMRESMEKSLDGRSANGEDINVAVSKYEQFNLISPTMLAQVKDFIGRQQAAAH